MNDIIQAVSGQAQLPIQLMEMDGAAVTLNYAYSRAEAIHSNSKVAPGLAGLGWDLPLDSVHASYPATAAPQDAEFAVLSRFAAGGLTYLRPSGEREEYALNSAPLMRVFFDRASNAWEFQAPDGIVYIYGDEARGATVEYAVATGAWTGGSNVRSLQARLPVTWYLSRIRSPFGREIVYSYEADEAPVTGANAPVAEQGLTYTRWTYLREISSSTGECIDLIYEDRAAFECPPPHGAQAASYQDRVQSRFLRAVQYSSATGALLREARLRYETNGATAYLGDADANRKRLLLAIETRSCSSASGALLAAPDTQYSYYGQDPGDGVSRSVPQAGPALYGALRQVVTPTGAVQTLSYASVAAGASARDFAIPLDNSESNPRAYFSDDFAVVTSLKSNALIARPCVRSGRWISSPAVNLSLGSAADYADAQVIMRPESFAILAGGSLYLAFRDIARPDDWVSAAYQVDADAELKLTGGDRFFALLDSTNFQLQRYVFRNVSGSPAWVAETPDDLLTPAPAALSLSVRTAAVAQQGSLDIDARGNFLTLGAVFPDQKQDTRVEMLVARLAADDSWSSRLTAETRERYRNPEPLQIRCGDGFSVATVKFPYDFYSVACAWDAELRRIDSKLLAHNFQQSGPAPAADIQGGLFKVGDQVYRYNAQTYKAAPEDVSAPAPRLVGTDVILGQQPDDSGGALLIIEYDSETNQYIPSSGPLDAVDSGMAVPLRSGADTNYLIAGGRLYCRDWSKTPGDARRWRSISNVKLPDSARLGDRYCAYQDGANVRLLALFEDQAQPAPGFPLSASATLLDAGPTAFALLQSGQVTLCWFENGSAAGLIATTPVGESAMFDGERRIVTKFEYADAGAIAAGACVFDGQPAFNRIRVRVGGALSATRDPAYANGWTEAFFFTGPAGGRTGSATLSLPYPADAPGLCNANAFPEAVSGRCYAANFYDADGALISSAEASYWTRPWNPGATGAGLITAITRIDLSLQGASTRRDFSYDALGRIVSETSTCATLDAASSAVVDFQEILTTGYFDAYYPDARVNLRGVAISSSRAVAWNGAAPAVTDQSVTTYRNWQPNSADTQVYAPFRTHVAITATAKAADAVGLDATLSDPDSAASPAGFQTTSAVWRRNSSGAETLTQDAGGRFHSLSYDRRSGLRPVAVFSGARADLDQCAYCGFDDYESANHGGWVDGGGRTLAAWIRSDDSKLGESSYYLQKGRPGPLRAFQPEPDASGAAGRYVFSCYVKTEAGYSGGARWNFKFADGGVAADPLELPATGQRWRYFQKIIELPPLAGSAEPPTLLIAADNSAGDGDLRLDQLRFAPTDAAFGATAYDSALERVSGVIGANGETQRLLYDGFNTPATIVMEAADASPYDRVAAQSVLGLSRLASGAAQPAADLPDHTVQIADGVASAYVDFRNARTEDWIFSSAGFSFSDNYLTASAGSTEKRATFQGFVFGDFALRVKIAARANGTNVSLGSDAIRATRSDAGWALSGTGVGGAPQRALPTAAEEDACLIAVDGFVALYVNGCQILAVPRTPPAPAPAGGQESGATASAHAILAVQNGSVNFGDFLLTAEPSLSLALRDAAGRPAQSLDLLGDLPVAEITPALQSSGLLAIGAGALYDEVGRAVVQRQATPAQLRFDAASLRLIAGPTSYLTNPDGAPVPGGSPQEIVANYVNGVADPASGKSLQDYMRINFDANPFSRPLQFVGPHERPAPGDVSEDGPYTTELAALNDAVCDAFQDLIGAPGDDARFIISQTTDGNGLAMYELADLSGRTLLRRAIAQNGMQLTSATLYDAAGNLIELRPPNYYAPPPGGSANEWKEKRSYDFSRRLTQRVHCDSGTTNYIYDSVGRLRFSQSAREAARNRVAYRKYDRAGRVIEKGTLDWSDALATLSGKADTAAWPDVQDATSANYCAGRWRKCYDYDVNADAPDEAGLLGRLWRTRVNNGDANPAADSDADFEAYRYDPSGRVLQHSLRLAAAGAATYDTSYVRDSAGRVTTIVYPATSAEADPLRVGYYYDRAGRLRSIGAAPGDGAADCYASYAYDRLGRIVSEALNNAQASDGAGESGGATGAGALVRKYAFDAGGLLKQIDDPYFSETLDYTRAVGEDPKQRRFDGRINATRFEYRAERWNCPPADYEYQYAYDGMQRLIEARHNRDERNSLYITADGAPVGPASSGGYDANGNLRSYRRGLSLRSYAYASDGASQQNRVQSIGSVTDASLDLSQTQVAPRSRGGRAGAFSWGSSNGGPSGAAVDGAALRLGGGGRAHYEFLRLESYLEPAGVYLLDSTLTVAPPESDETAARITGDAGWYLTGATPNGCVFTVQISGAASTGALLIDVAALTAGATDEERIDRVQLEFRNGLYNAAGGAGPTVVLSDVRVRSRDALTVSAYEYDAGGAIATTKFGPSFVQRTLRFDDLHGRVRHIAYARPEIVGEALTLSIDFDYGANNQRTMQTITDGSNAADGRVRKRIYLHGGRSLPLIAVDTDDSEQSAVSYIHGPNGMLAIRQTGGLRYILKDHLGSARVLVNEQGAVDRFYDYLPYGGLLRTGGRAKAASAPGAGGSNEAQYRYTGQERDTASDLYNYRARLYDPDLRRFYSTDPAGQYASPYSYVGGDPISRNDPSGKVGEALSFCFTSNKTKWYEYVGCTVNAPAIAIWGEGAGTGSMLLVLFGLFMRLMYFLIAYAQVGTYREVTRRLNEGEPRIWRPLMFSSQIRTFAKYISRLFDPRAPAAVNYHPELNQRLVIYETSIGDAPLTRHGGWLADRLWPLATYRPAGAVRDRTVPRVYRTNPIVNSLTVIMGVVVGIGVYASAQRPWGSHGLNIATEAAATHWLSYVTSGLMTLGLQRLTGPRPLRFTRFLTVEIGSMMISNFAASSIAYAPGPNSLYTLIPLLISLGLDVAVGVWHWNYGERFFGGDVQAAHDNDLELGGSRAAERGSIRGEEDGVDGIAVELGEVTQAGSSDSNDDLD